MRHRVIRRGIVAKSLERLRSQKTHTFFPGYLCLQLRSAELGRLDNLEPDFRGFFARFLEVKNHPLGTPYIKLFTDHRPSEHNLWLNKNVAGSYAPSSLRSNQPFRKVVRIEGKTYSLPSDHAALALKHLAYSKRIMVADLAAVLYRDYAMIGEDVTVEDLVDVFAYEFGYSEAPGEGWNSDFRTLFSLQSAEAWPDDWLEDV